MLPTITHRADGASQTRGISETPRLARLLALRAAIDAEISAEIALCQRLTGLPPLAGDEAELVDVARALGVRPEQLLAHDRRRGSARRRHLAAWMLHQRGLSLTRIGALLRRDHTTVLHSVRVVEQDPALRAAADAALQERSA